MKPPSHKDPVSNVALLERSLYFKQLQINRLLEVTQAINNNVKSPALYKIYKDILSWEMSVRRLLLVVREDSGWKCATMLGIDENLTVLVTDEQLPTFTKTQNISFPDHRLLSQFDVVVPVFHKEIPLAYAFIGGVNENDDLYEQIKFITTITNIITVAIENKRLFKQKLEQERLKSEMELAIQVQKMLIPSLLPANQDFELDGIYLPHSGVGGDYYDFIWLNERQFALCIADISGKGIGAALLMSNFQANLHALVVQQLPTPQFVQLLNQSVLRITGGERFITMFFAQYDLDSQKLTYVNAGHNPPVLFQGGELYRLELGCPLLGIIKKLPAVEVGEVQLSEESLLLSFTDGLTDLLDENEVFFGEERLLDFVMAHASHPVNDFNAKLLQRINNFRGERDCPDDISILTCRFFKKKT